MRGVDYQVSIDEPEGYEYGDKVRLVTDWYENHGYPFKKGDVFTVNVQYNTCVSTNRADFDPKELELIEEGPYH